MRANKTKGKFVMYETMQKLKGISCILSALSYQTETTQFKYQAEAMDFLSYSLDECIAEIEKEIIVD